MGKGEYVKRAPDSHGNAPILRFQKKGAKMCFVLLAIAMYYSSKIALLHF